MIKPVLPELPATSPDPVEHHWTSPVVVPKDCQHWSKVPHDNHQHHVVGHHDNHHVVAPVDEEQLMLVVEVGKVKVALPPRLSRVVQLFNEVMDLVVLL